MDEELLDLLDEAEDEFDAVMYTHHTIGTKPFEESPHEADGACQKNDEE